MGKEYDSMYDDNDGCIFHFMKSGTPGHCLVAWEDPFDMGIYHVKGSISEVKEKYLEIRRTKNELDPTTLT